MAAHVIRPVIFDIHGRLLAHFETSEEMLEELKTHEDARIRIAANAEMRHTLELAGRLLTIATQAEAMRDFQAAVLDALADAGIEVRREIMGLFEARAAEAAPKPEQPKPRRPRRKPKNEPTESTHSDKPEQGEEPWTETT